ncbi:MAG: DNA-binding transcriptional regulator [Paenibacillus sp.]|jgi:predicted DNA-binding transcriptional regulator YafY|nr:DNA-binding transcriptional regulator [Paenibacillus sp.]
MSKTDNLLAIIWLLKSRKRMTALQIAEELEISVRTVYRYMDTLCMSGVPVVSEAGHEGGFSLLDNFVDAPLFFNTDERKAVIHASQFARRAGYPFGDALESAINKIKQHANVEQLDELNRHTQGFEVIEAGAPHSPDSPLRLIEQAVADRHTLRIAYSKKGGASQQYRDIDPYGIVYWRYHWYVVAHCRLRTEIRNFRIDRIIEATPTGTVFERPDAFSASSMLLNSIFGGSAGQEPSVTVRIRGSRDAVSQLCRHWYLSHTLTDSSSDEAVFRVDASAIVSFMPQILIPYGQSLQILEPESLKDGMVAAASELLHYYQSTR